MRLTSEALEDLNISLPYPSPPLLQAIPVPKSTLKDKGLHCQFASILDGLHQKVPFPHNDPVIYIRDEACPTPGAILFVEVVLDGEEWVGWFTEPLDVEGLVHHGGLFKDLGPKTSFYNRCDIMNFYIKCWDRIGEDVANSLADAKRYSMRLLPAVKSSSIKSSHPRQGSTDLCTSLKKV